MVVAVTQEIRNELYRPSAAGGDSYPHLPPPRRIASKSEQPPSVLALEFQSRKGSFRIEERTNGVCVLMCFSRLYNVTQEEQNYNQPVPPGVFSLNEDQVCSISSPLLLLEPAWLGDPNMHQEKSSNRRALEEETHVSSSVWGLIGDTKLNKFQISPNMIIKGLISSPPVKSFSYYRVQI